MSPESQTLSASPPQPSRGGREKITPVTWRLAPSRFGRGLGGGRRRRAGGEGFTFIEISIVLVILVIIAAAIVPNLIAITRSRSLKDLEGSVARLPAEARNEAVRSQTPVQLRIDGTQIVMERVPVGDSPQQVKAVDLGTTITIDSVQLNGQTASPGSWMWVVYPDGSSDRGTIQFSEGAAQKTLILPSGGDARWVTGPAPDQTPDQWQAGQLQQRG